MLSLLMALLFIFLKFAIYFFLSLIDLMSLFKSMEYLLFTENKNYKESIPDFFKSSSFFNFCNC